MLKTQGTETLQVIDKLALDLAGIHVVIDQPAARIPGSNIPPVGPEHALEAAPRYLNDRAASIYGGSNEVQRSVLARLMLGL